MASRFFAPARVSIGFAIFISLVGMNTSSLAQLLIKQPLTLIGSSEALSGLKVLMAKL